MARNNDELKPEKDSKAGITVTVHLIDGGGFVT